MRSSLILLVCLGAFESGLAAPAKSPSLRAGAAAVDITPRQFPLNMPGGFSANMAQGAHDPLHARALVLSDGTLTLAMVVVDSLGVGRDTADEAKTWLGSNRVQEDASVILSDQLLAMLKQLHTP